MTHPQNKEELQAILSRYLSGTASPEECRFVEAYYNYVEGRPSAKEGRSSAEEGREGLPEGVRTRMLEQIEQRIRAEEGAPVYHLRPRRKKIGWWTAAAMIGVLLATGAYLWLRPPVGKVAIAKGSAPSATDIAPGGNRATLTLSNGRTIILDSAGNGLLAQQSGSDIRKTSGGHVSYIPNGNAPGQARVVFNTLTTPRGGQYQLVLPDGTKVWLNAASSITYPTAFTTGGRNVTITGEAYFEVAKDLSRPFHVRAGEADIAVLATQFNINAYGDEPLIRTTLLQGAVRVDAEGGSLTLRPGEQGMVGTASGGISLNPHVNLQQVMAWKNGELSISNGSVKQVLANISRWYDVDIEYRGQLPDLKFYGSISRNVPLSALLKALKAYGVETRLENRKLILL